MSCNWSFNDHMVYDVKRGVANKYGNRTSRAKLSSNKVYCIVGCIFPLTAPCFTAKINVWGVGCSWMNVTFFVAVVT